MVEKEKLKLGLRIIQNLKEKTGTNTQIFQSMKFEYVRNNQIKNSKPHNNTILVEYNKTPSQVLIQYKRNT